MIVVFLLLSAALLLLAVLLLWFVPHLLGQQERRATQEAQRLRALLSDVLGEQEAVAHRQSQLGTSLSFLQDQLEQMHTSWPATVAQLTTQPVDIGRPLMDHLDLRLGALQSQLEGWMNERRTRLNTVSSQENESWAYLMSLLGTMQEDLGQVNTQRRRPAGPSAPSGGLGGSPVVADLRDEVESLRMISEEIAALQWRLRRSVGVANSKNNGNGNGPGNNTTAHFVLGAPGSDGSATRTVRTS